MTSARLLLAALAPLWLAACGTNTTKPEVPQAAEKRPAASAEAPTIAPLALAGAVHAVAPLPDYSAASLQGDYADYAAAEALIRRMGEKYGFPTEYLYGVFSQVERDDWILSYLNRPRSTSTKLSPGGWTRYRKRFLTPTRIAEGLRFWRDYDAHLERAAREHGVPAEYIVAIMGVETNYGGYLGSHKVINALSTLAFDYPRRAAFFTDELEAFLIMTRNEGMDPFEPSGSYAGAMGLGQFMPSSFHRFAIDFDGDGRRDLWNPVDTIGSVANYFAGYGWRPGEPVAVRAKTQGRTPHLMEAGFKSRYAPDSLERQGVTTLASLEGHPEVSLLRLAASSGYEYWIGLNNFYVITRYNHSTYYAMAVHQLAQALRAQRDRDRQPGGPVMSLSNQPAASADA